MKQFLFSIFLFFSFYSTVLAQFCDSPTATDEINVNFIKADLPITGFVSTSSPEHTFSYFSDNTGESTDLDIEIKLWIAGLDPMGNLKMAAQTYSPLNGDNDFWTGPLDPNTGATNPTNCSDWDHFFSTTSFDIEPFLVDFSDGNVNQSIPPSILYWPARGNTHFFDQYGFELPNTSQGLAPFVDQNENGIYEPTLGDHPFIKGADKATWKVINDTGGVHTESNSYPLKAEIQIMAYAFDVDNRAVSHSIYYDVKLINRGIESLDQMAMSLWTDHDIGNCAFKQFSGCVPEKDMAFFYGNLTQSGSCVCNNVVLNDCTYPVVAIKLLQTPLAQRSFGVDGDLIPTPIGVFPDTLVESGLSSFLYYNNGSVGPPQSVQLIHRYLKNIIIT